MHGRRTINRELRVDGVGLHTGLPSSVTMLPSAAGTGIQVRFLEEAYQEIGTVRVLATDRCTRIQFDNGRTVDTVEHLMAALSIAGVTDILLSFDCAEAPILDGSSMPWLEAMGASGFAELEGQADVLYVVRPFELSLKGAAYSASPGRSAISVSIDFRDTPIGFQSIELHDSDLVELADSRTFVLEHEITALRSHGLALGGGLHNAVVIGADGPINPEGFRHPDECVRHKALDFVGDIFLAGRRLVGSFTAHRPGHTANSAFLKAMLDSGVLASGLSHSALAA
jgi:UDP-3-O-[3-hydroxymyristoyl] N-acetylglucosamine deacetylase